jgi:quercetin dioxygenase-like cupin family protein
VKTLHRGRVPRGFPGRNIRARAVGLLLLGVAAVACGGTSAATPVNTSAALARLMTLSTLAAGQLDSLPSGTQFVRIVAFHQSPNQSIASKQHQAGIVYVATGLQLLTYTGVSSVDIAAGTGLFLKSLPHSHTTLPPQDSTWYFIALWPSAKRPVPLVGSTAAYDSQDIPSTTLVPGTYVETLRRVTLQAGGRSPAHRFGGLEVIFVLDGTLTVDAGGQAQQLSTGAGTSVAPNTPSQEVAGSGKVDYLAFFVTEDGRPFET